jgi:hypothetical protein
MSMAIYQNTRRHIPADGIHVYCLESPRHHKCVCTFRMQLQPSAIPSYPLFSPCTEEFYISYIKRLTGSQTLSGRREKTKA